MRGLNLRVAEELADHRQYHGVYRKYIITARRMIKGWVLKWQKMRGCPCREAYRYSHRRQADFPLTVPSRYLDNFGGAYNFGCRLKTVKGLTPYEFTCKHWTSEPNRFTLDPHSQMPGLNTW